MGLETEVCGIMGGGGYLMMLDAAHQTINGINVAVVTGDGVIGSGQDVLDLLGSFYPEHADAVVIGEENLPPEFFALRTRLAGELLQKFVNYRVKVVVVGDFTRYESKALRDFIYECNQGRAICFVPTREEAMAWLTGQR